MKALVPIIFTAILITSSALANITDDNCKGILKGMAMNEQRQSVAGVTLVLYPIGVDLGYVLPTTNTDEHGAYHFDHVCEGRFTVLVQDERAGYAMPLWYFLLGKYHEVKLTSDRQTAEVRVDVPTKGSLLQIRVRNRDTKESLVTAVVMFKFVNHHNFDWMKFNLRVGEPIVLPSNTELLCRISAKGFRVWKDGNRNGKTINLAPEKRMTLEADIEPDHG